jgi:hypothetical protein
LVGSWRWITPFEQPIVQDSYKSTAQEKATMKVVFLLFVFVLLWANNAFAYLDPGTGSIIIQSIIALTIGALFTIKGYWSRLKSWFTNNKKPPVEKNPK